MRHRLPILSLLLLAASCSLPSPARAETFHTCAGFIDSVPATISTQGVWCLRKDLATAITVGAAIRITANNVTIDCNRFKLGGLAGGDGSQANGIYADDVQNATVRNCNIRGFGYGVNLDSGDGHLVEDNRFDNMLSQGISICCGSNNTVQRNQVYGTGGSTIFTSATAISATGNIQDNVVRDVNARASGIARGISAGNWGASIRDNVVTYIVSDATGTSTAIGIHSSDSMQTVEGNIVSALYAAPTGAAIGIHATSSLAQIVDNRISTSQAGVYGIRGSGADTVCKDNTAVNFTTAFSSCEASEGNVASP